MPLSHNKRPQSNHSKSYNAQSNHHDAAVQTRNSHGRVSIGPAAVAELHTKTKHRQPQKHHATAPLKNKTTSITWPQAFDPQHDTAPPLDSAQE
jgi:hypothetical protein